MREVLLAAVAAVAMLALPPVAGAQETAPTTAPAPVPESGRMPAQSSESANDATKSDDTGVTGWSGSWSANEGSQTGDAATGTSDQAKPLPPVAPPQ